MSLSTIKDVLAGAYRGSPGMTVFCIYVIFLIGAVFTHQFVKGISKQNEVKQPAPAGPNPVPSIVTQQSTDSDCSNIVAGNDASVDCPSLGKDHDKKKAPPQH